MKKIIHSSRSSFFNYFPSIQGLFKSAPATCLGHLCTQVAHFVQVAIYPVFSGQTRLEAVSCMHEAMSALLASFFLSIPLVENDYFSVHLIEMRNSSSTMGRTKSHTDNWFSDDKDIFIQNFVRSCVIHAQSHVSLHH